MGWNKVGPTMARKAKIVCRICGPEGNKINRQSYRDHLWLVHDDTSGDLREWGQASLAFTAARGVPRPATRSRSRSPLGGGGDRAWSRSHSSAQDPGEEERGRSRGRSRSSEADRSSSEESDRSSSVARDRGTRAGRKGSTAAGRSRSRRRVGERERSPSRVRNYMEPIMMQVDRMIKNIGIEVDSVATLFHSALKGPRWRLTCDINISGGPSRGAKRPPGKAGGARPRCRGWRAPPSASRPRPSSWRRLT